MGNDLCSSESFPITVGEQSVQQETPAVLKPAGLTIYGDMFNADTRALIAECRYGGINHEFVPIDTFDQEMMDSKYAAVNPIKAIPMIIDGQFKIMGENRVLHDWVMLKGKAGLMLQPPEQEMAFNLMQRYFFKEVRGITSQLIRRLGMRVLKPD